MVVWAVQGHFQGGSLCLASSVCWSLQCLISTLTQGGQWWTHFFFFKAHLFSHAVGREGCCKQITLACALSVSATLGMPLLVVHTTKALCCSARNLLRPALGCMHLSGLSHSGSALRQPLEAQIRLGLCFVPLPGPGSSGVWRARSLRLIAFPCCSVFWVYCWRPSQADGDCREPQEVLVSKEACLQFGR